jgi:hypothetical protein
VKGRRTVVLNSWWIKKLLWRRVKTLTGCVCTRPNTICNVYDKKSLGSNKKNQAVATTGKATKVLLLRYKENG